MLEKEDENGEKTKPFVPLLAWSDIESKSPNPLEFLARPANLPAIDYAVQNAGHSMEPDFKPGDFLFIQRGNAAKTGEYVLAATKGQSPQFRQYVLENDKPFLYSLDPTYSPRYLKLDKSSKIYGIVRGLYRPIAPPAK
jgi:SOS-response transcriptional repressor LexA